LLNKLEAELAPQADRKNLLYRSWETQAIVHSDPQLLALILRNFISNAIRYTEKGGVLVGCRQQGGATVVEVWDTGIGIEAAHQKDIFREFHQLGNPERDRSKGLGLGLAIANGLAQLLKHSLTLSSQPARGSVFRLALPPAPVNEHAIDAEANGEMPSAHSLLEEKRILLIDDDEAVRTGMRHLLRDWGCECDIAEGLEEAQLLIRLHTPDIIISDYRLREKHNGAEVITALRLAMGSPVPALLITGDTAPERLREALASGIPLLHKPVTPAQLQRKLLAMLE